MVIGRFGQALISEQHDSIMTNPSHLKFGEFPD